MPEFTRRGFLRSASISAAALGALSALPSLARADGAGIQPQPAVPAAEPASATGLAAAPQVATPVVVFFDDLSSGKGRVFVGEQAIDFDNPALVQGVQAVIG